MRRKPVYVQLDMQTDMDTLWEHTQIPRLHEQWDVRFSKIDYLPRDSEDAPQQFEYITRIGAGMAIKGTGETQANQLKEGGRMSTLVFASDQPFSLIRHGSGYWRYEKRHDHISFMTRFDYDTRFGLCGYWLDRLLFRPLFGRATAWSFDVLRIWLEQYIPPAITIRNACIHYCLVIVLAVLWIYQGLVPKLLYPDAGELAMLQSTGWAPGYEVQVVKVLGIAEILLGVLILLQHRKRWTYGLHSVFLLGLTLPVLWSRPELLSQPFQPLTFMLALLGCGLAAAGTRERLPHAGRCRRRPAAGAERRESADAFYIPKSNGGRV
ncbi:DoxX-like family protein [Paenibacillus sp. 1P07SE]|uniref:DoxX-like family protein n=1 Tax=Paenibacillus sp. 1P07SE TaxID=3132209 RepID=UPI0039A6221A